MRRTLLALLLGPSVAAIAAPPTIVDEIVTTAQRRASQADIAGNVVLLGEQEIEDIGHLHVEDALVRLPGVALHQGNGQEYLPAVRSAVLSGGGACGSFLTAQDNIPLRAAGFCNINELFEANTEQAERIEVIRGPSNALYGSNAQHGVINVILPSVPETEQAAVGLEAGAYDFRRESVSYGNRSGGHGFLINLTATHDGGYRDEAYYDQQKLQARHETTAGRWDIATTFTAANLNQETAGFIEGFEAYKDRDLAKQNLNPEAYRDARSFRLYSRLQTQLDNDQTIIITPYLRKTDMDFLQHFLPGTPLEENGQRSIGAQFAWYDDGDDNWHWIAGFDGEFTRGYLRETQAQPTMGSPFLQETLPAGKHYDYEVDALQLAPFVHLDWQLSDALIVNAGLRVETMRYDYDNKMLAGRTRDDGTTCGFGGCRYTRPADRNDNFTNVSPKIGMLYKFAENHELFINLSNGFRAPQATELYRLQDGQTVANLDSEELESLEVGFRGRGDRFRYETIAYAMQKENIIFRDPSARTNLGDGKTEHAGLELLFAYEISDAWDARTVFNFANHRYDGDQSLSGENIDGNREDSAPQRFGSAHLGWNFVAGARAELEYIYMGSYYTDPENAHKYDGHDLFNLRARWMMNDSWRFNLRVMNLTDTEYADRADFTTFGGDRYFPGTPRAVYAGVNYSF